MTTTSDMREKIRKLQAKANDSSLTEAESALFAAKVAELLAQHNLEKEFLVEKDDEVEEDKVDLELDDKAFVFAWKPTLANAVGKLYFCKVFIKTTAATTATTNKQKRLAFVGKPHNREVTISMYRHFTGTINRMAKERYTNKGDIAEFEKGCGCSLALRIFDHYMSLQKDPVHRDTSVPALYKNEEKQVADFMSNIPLVRAKRVTLSNTGPAEAGRRAAQDISLSMQTGGGQRYAALK